jgi:hypothetical protein
MPKFTSGLTTRCSDIALQRAPPLLLLRLLCGRLAGINTTHLATQKQHTELACLYLSLRLLLGLGLVRGAGGP